MLKTIEYLLIFELHYLSR